MPEAGKQKVDLDKYALVRTRTMRVLTGVSIWIGVMLTALLVLVAIELGHNHGQDSKLTRLTNQTIALQHQEARNNLANCERGNESRVASINEKRQGIKSAKSLLAFWESLVESNPAGVREAPPALKGAFVGLLQVYREEIRAKRHGIQEAIAAQEAVAVSPGSPIVDCSKAFNKGGHGVGGDS